MRGSTTHPGVNLTQRAKAGTWFIRFFDGRSGERMQVSKSTLTDDFDIATRIAREVYAFISSPDLWDSPATTWHPRTYELLGIQPRDADSITVAYSMRHLNIAAKMGGVDASPTTNRVNAIVDTIQRRLDTAVLERDEWKRRAIAAEALNARHGAKANKTWAALDSLTLKDAVTIWTGKLIGDSEYVSNQTFTALSFVRKFGEKTTLLGMAGREGEIDEWIRGIKRRGGKRKDQPISATRRHEVRRVVIKFLRDSGLELDKSAIRRPTRKDMKNDRGAIRWLTKKQARAVASKFTDSYFEDCFRLQLALGLRPNELITLKAADFSEIGGVMSLTLSPLDTLTLKEGSRTVIVPEKVQGIVKRRLKNNTTLFPQQDGKPWEKAELFDRRYRKALRLAGTAAGVPFALDCRIARRTCATILLGAGVAPKAVADILGDNLDTVVQHYGASIPGTNDPSKAAI